MSDNCKECMIQLITIREEENGYCVDCGNVEKLIALEQRLKSAEDKLKFYANYSNFKKHPDEEFIVETMGLTLKQAQLGYQAREHFKQYGDSDDK